MFPSETTRRDEIQKTSEFLTVYLGIAFDMSAPQGAYRTPSPVVIAAGVRPEPRKYGSLTALVMTGMDVLKFESPRVSQRTVFMADDCPHCREELARLTEENAALRRAALAFGSLAERLNLALQEERRLRQRSSGARDTAEAVKSSSTPAPRVRPHGGLQG